MAERVVSVKLVADVREYKALLKRARRDANRLRKSLRALGEAKIPVRVERES